MTAYTGVQWAARTPARHCCFHWIQRPRSLVTHAINLGSPSLPNSSNDSKMHKCEGFRFSDQIETKSSREFPGIETAVIGLNGRATASRYIVYSRTELQRDLCVPGNWENKQKGRGVANKLCNHHHQTKKTHNSRHPTLTLPPPPPQQHTRQ
jgi:hypothetical protein